MNGILGLVVDERLYFIAIEFIGDLNLLPHQQHDLVHLFATARNCGTVVVNITHYIAGSLLGVRVNHR